MPLSKEDAAKGGRASAEARRRKKALAADVKAKKAFENAADKMAQILINAALGEGEFARLEPKDRAQFAQKVLEYAVGRPRQADPTAPEQEAPKGGLSFTIGAPQGDMVAHPEPEG